MADAAEKTADTPTRTKTAKADKTSTMVTYVPGDGDPAETTWNGHKFQANVPRPVSNPTMVELAKGNMCFEVEGHDKKAAPPPGAPKTPEEYKAYAVGWFKKAKSAADFQERWEDEAPLREKAGVGTDDVEWLQSIGDPILAELKKADE